MTLFIACLIIHGLDLHGGLYLLAIIVWVAKFVWEAKGEGKMLADLEFLKRQRTP